MNTFKYICFEVAFKLKCFGYTMDLHIHGGICIQIILYLLTSLSVSLVPQTWHGSGRI